MASRQEPLIHAGTFERVADGASALEGVGTMEVLPTALRVRAGAVPTTLVLALSGLAATISMMAAVIVAMLVLDRFALIGDGDSLRPAVAVGAGALVASFLAAKTALGRSLRRRPVEHAIPFRYLVSATAHAGALHVACTYPACAGRITFRTEDPSAVLNRIERAAGD